MEKRLLESQAGLKITNEAILDGKKEISNLRTNNQDLEATLHRQAQQIHALQQSQRQLENQLLGWSEKHGQQRRINSELMRRKEQIEWELVELQTARLPLSASPTAEGVQSRPVSH